MPIRRSQACTGSTSAQVPTVRTTTGAPIAASSACGREPGRRCNVTTVPGVWQSVTRCAAVLLVAVGAVACGSTHPAGPRAVDTTTPTPSTRHLADPFAGRAVPSSGFVVLDDPKDGTATRPSSWAISLLDDAGTHIGGLPRAVVSDDVLNSPALTLVVSDTGVRLEQRVLPVRGDDPSGCTTTATTARLRVALCGTRFGNQLLGDRIAVRRGTAWTTLVAKPPAPNGNRVAGHWEWAAPSPDGRWVLAGWSGECEVQTALLVSLADDSVRAVTGERAVAWRSAPESSALGWTRDGAAISVFGGDSGCGATATVRRGIYRVAPADAARRLLVPLSASEGVLRWDTADDRRAQ